MLSKIFNRLIFVCFLQIFPVNCNSENSVFLNESSRVRHKRTLNFYFPFNSCYAVSELILFWKVSISEYDLSNFVVQQTFHVVTIFNNYFKTQKTSHFISQNIFQLAVVMSLPLEDLPAGQSVFCSYNFEANFYYPYFDNAFGLVPLPFAWV